ncbi:hypothetical protein [Bacillus pumilus]|uniref:hypothetical protein n=1 Tax=Bacillus TaxID=1386 RepID=UPI0004A14FAF|nr:hypothetical protein [Bacillus pumilus]MCY7617826.1 DUF4258 domain-containing protein [Bacillus pumilus]QKN76481.1 DUF4258 domain-containing protein [Bacillus pumilus]QLI44426.1 DUF4258 domain-containing protein [Bacillus pumilus]
MKNLKEISCTIALIMLFTIIGPTITTVTAQESEYEETTEPQNNTSFTDEKLLKQDISLLINDQNIINDAKDIDHNMSDKEKEQYQEKFSNLKESAFKLDDETLSYIDNINPDIDVQLLIDQEEQIKEELALESEVDALIAPILIRGAISATVFLLRKAGIRVLTVSWHVGLRMIQRQITPKQVFDAVKYGKKYYDPKYNSTVYHYKGVAVAKQGNTLTTTYKSGVKKRWKK